jgi:2-polyprenyl-3-methyl-5-hydroxy-6-metoxy-1,4-benzoquinol methylase
MSILDLGCGEGILRERLGSSSIERYTGVDWSNEAVELARQRDNERAEFIPASIDEWIPDGRYDAIVFNEVLYYLPQPLVTVARYARSLTDSGSMFVSMWNPAVLVSARSPVSMRRLRVRLEYSLLWKRLDRQYDVLADVVAKRDRLRTWRIQEFRPWSL